VTAAPALPGTLQTLIPSQSKRCRRNFVRLFTDGELEALEREFDAVAAADADATAGLASKAQADWRRGVAVSEQVQGLVSLGLQTAASLHRGPAKHASQLNNSQKSEASCRWADLLARACHPKKKEELGYASREPKFDHARPQRFSCRHAAMQRCAHTSLRACCCRNRRGGSGGCGNGRWRRASARSGPCRLPTGCRAPRCDSLKPSIRRRRTAGCAAGVHAQHLERFSNSTANTSSAAAGCIDMPQAAAASCGPQH
jgi:hypothetical protein